MIHSQNNRLLSIDALRGFDMFWIIGGAWFVRTLVGDSIGCQFDHVEWEGLHFIDLIFPVFVFISGLTFPFSHAKRVASGESVLKTHCMIFRRTLLLLVLGALYNGLLKSDFHHLADFRYFSVLGKIGIAWGVAALVYVHFKPRMRILLCLAGLVSYWIMMLFVAPDAPAGANSFSLEGCFVGWLDRMFTPGHLYCDNLLEPSGPFVSFFGFPTALLGMFAGDIVRARGGEKGGGALHLSLLGLACLALGYGLSPWMPVVKKLWTPTFALVSSGYGLIAFALFHYLIDVRGWTRWSFALQLIGVNAIAIYFSGVFVNYGVIGDFFVAGIASLAGSFAPTVHALGALGVRFVLLGFLYRRRIFFKV